MRSAMFNYLSNFHSLSWMTFNFWDDFLLLALLFVQLVIVSYFNLTRPEYAISTGGIHQTPAFRNAKVRFYILFRLLYRVFVGLLVLKAIWLLICYGGTPAALSQQAPADWGIFIRNDAVCRWLTFFITLLGFYFCNYLRLFMRRRLQHEVFLLELPLFLVLIVLALRLLINTNDLLLVILAFEIVAFCIVVLVASQNIMGAPWTPLALEAATKYFILNGVAVALLLLALAGFYFLYGTTNILLISTNVILLPYTQLLFFEPLLLTHIVFFLAYFLKIGAAPFHQWVPDVYDGAELPVTILLMTLVGPVFLLKLVLIYLSLVTISFSETLFSVSTLFYGSGLCSVLIGTVGAFAQTRVKRFFAYTGIVHMGFILLALSCHSFIGIATAFFYILAYVLMMNGVFTIMVLNAVESPGKVITDLNDWKTVTHLGTYLIGILVILLFSLAGAPPFVGFFAKFFVLASLVERSASFLTLAFLLVAIVINAYLYFRFINLILFEERVMTQIVRVRWLHQNTQYQVRNRLLIMPSRFVNYSTVSSGFLIFCCLFVMGFLPYLETFGYLFVQWTIQAVVFA